MHLQWRELLEIGVAEMDDDHRCMVALLNQIQDVSDDGDCAAVLPHLRELERFTREHFAREDALMRQIAYPMAGQHRLEHERLLYEVGFKIADIERGRIVAGAVAVFLQRWLIRHIADDDARLGAALKAFREVGRPLPGEPLAGPETSWRKMRFAGAEGAQ